MLVRSVAACAALLLAADSGRSATDDIKEIDALRDRFRVSGEEALPAIRAALDSPSPVVRHGAADILTRYGGSDVELLFLKRIRSDSAETREVAAAALGRVGESDAALRALRIAAGDPSPLVRWSSVLSLGSLVDTDSEDLLREIAAGDSYRDPAGGYPVRDAAGRVLEALPRSIRWRRSLERALENAMTVRKPVFLLFEARGEELSEKMRSALARPVVVTALMPWVCVRLDATREPQIRDDFEIRGVPTSILLAPDGREIERWPGYMGPEAIERRLREVVSGGAASETRQEAVDRRQDPASQWSAAVTFMDEGREARAIEFLEQVLVADPGNRYGYTDDALFALGYCHGKTGRHARAAGCLERLLRRYPRFDRAGQAWYCLGLSRLALGDREGAEVAWRRAEAAGDPDVAESVARVRRGMEGGPVAGEVPVPRDRP